MNTLIIFGAKYLFLVAILGGLFPLLVMFPEEKVRYVVTVIVSGVIAFLLTQLAGMIYFDPRPFAPGVHALIPHEPDNGFPSDHTVFVFTTAFLILKTSKAMCIGLGIIGVLVGLCRILAGIHSPLDILAGILVAFISVWSGNLLAHRFLGDKSSWSS